MKGTGGERPVDCRGSSTLSASGWKSAAWPASARCQAPTTAGESGSVPSWLAVQAVQCCGFLR